MNQSKRLMEYEPGETFIWKQPTEIFPQHRNQTKNYVHMKNLCRMKKSIQDFLLWNTVKKQIKKSRLSLSLINMKDSK